MTMDSFIRKEDSKYLYGIAILLMIFHHCFLDPARLNHAYISSWGNWAGIETRLAWQGKLCVAIYAFISGYALAQWSLKSKDASLIAACRKSLGQMLRIYRQYWLVFVMFVPLAVFYHGWKISSGIIVRGLLYGEVFLAEWWYVKQYLRMMLIFPVLNFLIQFLTGEKPQFISKAEWESIDKKKRNGLILLIVLFAVCAVVLRLFLWNTAAGKAFAWCIKVAISVVNSETRDYDIIFIEAYLLSRFRIYERIPQIQKLATVGILGACAVVAARYLYVRGPGQSNCDVILTPFLIYFLVCVSHALQNSSAVKRVLQYLGEHSTFMWLTHTLWIYVFLKKIILLPRYSIPIYVWAVIVSLAGSIMMSWIYGRLAEMANRLHACVCKRGS